MSRPIRNTRKDRSSGLQAKAPPSLENPPVLQWETTHSIRTTCLSQPTRTTTTTRPHQQWGTIWDRGGAGFKTMKSQGKKRPKVKRSHWLFCQMERMDERTQFMGVRLRNGQCARSNTWLWRMNTNQHNCNPKWGLNSNQDTCLNKGVMLRFFCLILSYPKFLTNLILSQNPYPYYHNLTRRSQSLYYSSLPLLA